MSTSSFIDIQELGKNFGPRKALIKLSLSFNKGAKIALLGPNGAGKSTFIKLLTGVLKPTEGFISIDGLSPQKTRLKPGFLGWLPERAPLYNDLTVREHLGLAGRLKDLTLAESRRETERLTLALSLEDKLDRLAGRLSLGSRRQAALALALLGQPELLILDEPTSSLDPVEVKKLRKLLEELKPETTLIISSHILPEVAAQTEQAIILKNGLVAATGTWTDLSKGKKDWEDIYLSHLEAKMA